MNRIRAITLDLDDTLWAIGPVIRRAEAETWRWIETHYPRIVERYTPESSLELRRGLVERHPDKAHDFGFLRRSAFGEMAAASGYDADFPDVAYAEFQRWRNDVTLFDDVIPGLERLKEGYIVLAVTNGNASLEHIGIGRYFDGCVSAARAGAAKPSAAIFHAAVTEAGVESDEVLHVGDHPELDVAGAADAGLRTAWMNRAGFDWPDHLERPDAEVADMLALCKLLSERDRG